MQFTQDDFHGRTIFLYKLTTDNGGAPCVYKGLLSLAICKPQIRTSAREGDWIVGFGGRSIKDLKDRLIYIARVTKAEKNGDYYTSAEYQDRPDCIYKRNGLRYEWRKGSKYHGPENLEHDLGGSDKYDRAWVLLSDAGSFIYRGRQEEPSIEDVQDIYNNLPRNFIHNLDGQTRERMVQFILRVMKEYGRLPSGKPTHADTRRPCGLAEDDDVAVLKPSNC